jgi:hypothetical protein
LQKSIEKARILVGAPEIGTAAYVRGNAAGIHGGRKLKYGKRERQANRREETE